MRVAALRASDTLASGENQAHALNGGLTCASSGTREFVDLERLPAEDDYPKL
jgi:hypothetical protein